jgi:glycosyltransferase involved in cell wall biosynthesis
MPDISVLLSAYREPEEQFDSAVRSVVLQTLPPRQLVIVDDSGEYRYRQQCENLKNTLLAPQGIELCYIGNPKNAGLVASLNLGLSHVSGEYVARMDADDISLANRFQKQLDKLYAGCDVVGGGITSFDAIGNLRDTYYPATRLGVLYSLLRNNPIAHPVSMFKTAVVRALQGYRQINYCEDLDLWMRAYRAGYRITNVPAILLLRRVHEQQISCRHSGEQRHNTHVLRRAFLVGFFGR